MNRFIVNAQYMVDGAVQERTFTVYADSIFGALRRVRTEDLFRVTRIVLDRTRDIVDPFGMPEETEDKNV